MKSTAPPRSRRNDAQADVVFPPKNRQTGQTAQATPPEAPPVPRPQPMAKTACATATPATRPQPSLAGPDSQAQAQAVLSPNKRRGSPEQPVVQDVSAADTEPSEQQSPKATKRAKAEESPPKILPQQYEFCEPVDMVELIAHMLSELITTNDAIRISNGGLTRFHSRFVLSRRRSD